MKKKTQNRIIYTILVCVIILISSPTLYNLAPAYWGTPDIQYVKAKIHRVLEGDIFLDPITGIPNFHPPFYHVFLSAFVKLGLSIDTLLVAISLINTACTILLSFLICRQLWDQMTGLYVGVLIPFLQEFMGPGYLFLATSFYFSLPVYLAGLYLCLKRANSVCWGFLWAIAFLISPVYVFLIGLTLVYKLIALRDFRYVLPGVVAFFLTISPFYWQLYTIYSSGLAGTAAFSTWRGIPHLGSIMPMSWKGWVALLGYAILVCAFIRFRKVHYYFYISIIATLLTAYHFNPEYGNRILFVFSILACGYLIHNLNMRKIYVAFPIALLIVAGIYVNLDRLRTVYKQHKMVVPTYIHQGRYFRHWFEDNIESNELLLAYHDTYRYSILPFFPVYGLVAYKSGEYFQLNGEIADKMLHDYETIMNADNIKMIDSICEKYNISTAVVYGSRDQSMAPFQLIAENWKPVYGDLYYRVYKRQ